MASLSRGIGTVEDQELLWAVASWNYRDYVRQCSGCYDGRRCLTIAMVGGSMSFNDL